VIKFLHDSWLVLLLSVVFALLLAGAQRTFGPSIEANRRAELERAARAVVQGQVESLEESQIVVDKEAFTVFRCRDAGGQLIGWALVGSGFGFQDTIKLVVGLSPDGDRITGLQVVENTETPGLGNKITDPQWASQYDGLDSTRPVTVVKVQASGEDNEVQAITGATISSEAVTRIANEAIRQVRPRLDEAR
jgi:electron transport complex protein RnfG